MQYECKFNIDLYFGEPICEYGLIKLKIITRFFLGYLTYTLEYVK